MTEKNCQPTIDTTTTPTEKASEPIVATENSVVTKLQSLGVPENVIAKIQSDLGAETVEDLAGLTEEDLVRCDMKVLPARNLVKSLKATEPKVEATSSTVAANMASPVSFDAVLPAVASDESWLAALRAGGVLKVDQSTVIAAIRAALAHRMGLFSIPERLVELMEKFAESMEEQIDPEYFSLRNDLTRRSYAEIFQAIPGLNGSYVTEPRKKQLFQRIDQNLWPAIINFYNQLKSWQEAWMQGAANPTLMIGAMMGAMSGGGVMPPGMMQPPDTGILRDQSEAVADAINKVFAGTGVQITSALAFEANKIKETMANPRLPALTGAGNRDQLLRQMDIAVNATYPRLEQNLTRFVLAIMQVKDQTAGNEELAYFGALFMLGSQIPWDQINNERFTDKPLSGIGARNPRSLNA